MSASEATALLVKPMAARNHNVAGNTIARARSACALVHRTAGVCWSLVGEETWSDSEFDHLFTETDIRTQVQVVKGEFHDSDEDERWLFER